MAITADYPNAPYVGGIVTAWAARVGMDADGGVPDMIAVAEEFTALHYDGRPTEFVDNPENVDAAVRALLGDQGSCMDTIQYSREGVEINRIPVLRS